MDNIRVIMTALHQIFANQRDTSPVWVKRWFGLIFPIIFLLGLVYLCLQLWWTPQFANRWLVIAASFTAGLIVMVQGNSRYNHRPGERKILTTFGAGNYLTIFRGVMITFLAGFLISPRPPGWLAWMPGVIYILAAVMDLFDGYLARRSNQVTRLGEILDMKLDGLGVLVACLLIVQYGQVPAWYLLVGLARYLFIAGEWVLEKLSLTVFEPPPNPARRPLAGAQMGFTAAVLLPIFSPPGTYLVAGLFALPFLIGFAYDWLVVSGSLRINITEVGDLSPGDEAKLAVLMPWLISIKSLIIKWLPLVVRITLVVLLISWMVINVPGILNQWGSLPSNINTYLPYPGFFLGLMLFLIASGLVFLILGVAGRLAALLILFGMGLFQTFAGLGWMEVIVLVEATLSMYLGTGPYSLWAPEEKILAKRIGEVN